MTTTELSLTHFRLNVDEDGIATVLIDRAGESMNTISPDLIEDMDRLLDRLEDDASIRAVVIASAKPDNFLAGADIRVLQSLTDAETATAVARAGQERFARLEALHRQRGKPVVAAIHGPCLGGGLELALACSGRIASSDERRTQLGQPEVQIGIIPGAGGTQRLPRLIGIAAALDLILTGRALRPRRARALGLVDEVVPRELLLTIARQRAMQARTGGDGNGRLERLKELASPSHLQQLALEENPVGRRLLWAKAEQDLLRKTRGRYPAPEAALAVIKTGVDKGPEAGYAAEAEAMGRLAVTPEARALRSIFFATQALKKDTGVEGRDVETRPLQRVAVLGGGLMGGGIAAVTAARAGLSVRIKEIDEAGVRRGLAYVGKYLNGQVKRRRMRPRQAARTMNLVTATQDWSGFASTDVVIEAVFEDLELKRSILAEVEAATGPETIFASNTSSLPIADIAANAERPQNVIGMHYFSPVEKMPLLEIIVTDQTADWVTATCVALGKSQGKTVIVVNDGTGFYTTRILGPYMNEMGWLLADGASVEDIDGAMVDWGFPVGPVVLADEVGLDVGAKIGVIMEKAFGSRMAAPAGLAALVADDRKGRKNGRGFYRYEDGEKKGVDETVYQVLGIGERTQIDVSEIQERLALAMINEAALCLQDGILRSALDGDIGAVFGLGFPAYTGGPFTYVDQMGAKEVVARLEALAERFGDRFEPAQILRDHAASGELFRR